MLYSNQNRININMPSPKEAENTGDHSSAIVNPIDGGVNPEQKSNNNLRSWARDIFSLAKNKFRSEDAADNISNTSLYNETDPEIIRKKFEAGALKFVESVNDSKPKKSFSFRGRSRSNTITSKK